MSKNTSKFGTIQEIMDKDKKEKLSNIQQVQQEEKLIINLQNKTMKPLVTSVKKE